MTPPSAEDADTSPFEWGGITRGTRAGPQRCVGRARARRPAARLAGPGRRERRHEISPLGDAKVMRLELRMLGEGGDVADARPGDLRRVEAARQALRRRSWPKASCTILLVSSRRSLRALPVAYFGSFSRPGRSMTLSHSRVELAVVLDRDQDRHVVARRIDAVGRDERMGEAEPRPFVVPNIPWRAAAPPSIRPSRRTARPRSRGPRRSSGARSVPRARRRGHTCRCRCRSPRRRCGPAHARCR